MNNKKIVFIAVGLIFILGIILAIFFDDGLLAGKSKSEVILLERNDAVPSVSYLNNFGSKIVYTTNTTVNKDEYINDCSARGGVFNYCGNVCAPNASSCSQQCALTCESK